MLTASDAAAAIIQLEDGRYVMQLRDDRPDIWYPGHWGCFGGGVNPGESPEAALQRELFEELELEINNAVFFTQFDFDLRTLGMGKYYRIYYHIMLSMSQLGKTKLHEGTAIGNFTGQELLSSIRVTPYDAFALQLFHNRL